MFSTEANKLTSITNSNQYFDMKLAEQEGGKHARFTESMCVGQKKFKKNSWSKTLKKVSILKGHLVSSLWVRAASLILAVWQFSNNGGLNCKIEQIKSSYTERVVISKRKHWRGSYELLQTIIPICVNLMKVGGHKVGDQLHNITEYVLDKVFILHWRKRRNFQSLIPLSIGKMS